MRSLLLSKERIALFQENGFVTVEDLIEQEELDILRQTSSQLLQSQAGKEAGDQFDLAGKSDDTTRAGLTQIMTPSKYAPQLAGLKYRNFMKAMAEQLLEEDVKLLNEHLLYKPAHYGSETPWHQDQAYHDPSLRYHTVNVWLALADATLENGCMQYVPESHRLDVLPHHNIGNDPRSAGLEVDRPERFKAQAVTCPIEAGSAVMHSSYVLHYAGANLTDQPRPAYVLVFGGEPKQREFPLEFPWLTKHHDGVRSGTQGRQE
jgi:ectoine hydroxylase-related dioxygenase (phytanoyl-CoA dioxygenase family)